MGRYVPSYSDELWEWKGSEYVYSGHEHGYVWRDKPAPEPGESARMSDFRHLGSPRGASAVATTAATHVSVPCTLAGDYCGDDVQASNFRALVRDYPDTFIETNGDYCAHQLVIALDQEIDDSLLEILYDLRDDYPVYDEEDHSCYQMEQAWESWDSWLRYDIVRIMRDIWRGRTFTFGRPSRFTFVNDSMAALETRLGLLDHEDARLDDLDEDWLRERFFEITGDMPEPYYMESADGVVFPYLKQTAEAILDELGMVAA